MIGLVKWPTMNCAKDKNLTILPKPKFVLENETHDLEYLFAAITPGSTQNYNGIAF